MVRGPCCEKMGLKKGPWTTEEDQILISHIQIYGHDNWRALPKQAGLLRCGKSCRLRWTNYLRPDIKRGNFTKEEEDTILNLHERLGNRWSAIASRLPGRTDNEIKNVWHSHLKKKAKQNPITSTVSKHNSDATIIQLEPMNSSSPQHYSSREFSSAISSNSGTASAATVTITGEPPNSKNINNEHMDSSEYLTGMDESFLAEALSAENCSLLSEFLANNADDDHQFQLQLQFPNSSSIGTLEQQPIYNDGSIIDDHDDKDFWYNLFVNAGGRLSEF